ncbi:MAG: CPBP family intramembrane metalloprotease [Clostridium argentinense]|nr:CPBP family intramembrane metalloprotease [Clostridium argentinense]
MGSKIKSFFMALGYLLIAAIIQIIVSFIGGTITAKKHLSKQVENNLLNMESQNMTNMINEVFGNFNYILLVSSILTVLIFLLIYKIKKRKLFEEILLKRTKNINFGTGILTGIFAWLFNSGILYLLLQNRKFLQHFDTMDEILNPLYQGNLFIIILTIGIVAPFVEEFLFRGIVYKTLSKNISISAVIVIQGILFGIYHLNIIQAVYASLLGIIFGFIKYKTQSLWPAIAAHIANNIMAVIIPTIAGDKFSSATCIIFIIIGLIGTIITLFFIHRNNPKTMDESIKINSEIYDFEEY